MRPRLRIVLAASVLIACAAGGSPAAPAAHGTPSVVFVTSDCASRDFVCPAFVRAAARTGVRARIVAPDRREDVVGVFELLAEQGHDLVIGDPDFGYDLVEAASRHPAQRFAVMDVPLPLARPRPPNVAALELRPREAAYLAGWLAARMERRRPGPDVVGAVGGVKFEPVEEFIVGFRAGARRASPGVRVLTAYSGDFADTTRCSAIAHRQIAEGAGTVFDVAGGCGRGTLEAARRAGVWAIGVDRDRSGLGPHILTSVLKRYDRGFAVLMRQAGSRRLPAGRSILLGLRRGGAELGRISHRIPPPVLEELAAVRRLVASGRIRVPGPSYD